MPARSSSRWLRLGATTAAAAAVAQAAAWLLRPRRIERPVRVDEGEYFSQADLKTAREYAAGQRLILVGSLAAEGTLLALLAAGRPAAARRALEGLRARPAAGGALAAAGLSGALALVTIPFGVAAHGRSVRACLSTQPLGGWLRDWAKATAIGAAFAGLTGSAALSLMRRFGLRWWAPGSVAVTSGGALLTWLAPMVLAPLFNRFEPLPEGEARNDVLELAGKAGVDVGEVYRVDASRRTNAINAYVNGIGPSKRVVLYDTLIDDLERAERRSVIAHELAHVHGRDILRGLIFIAAATPLALISASGAASSVARPQGIEPGEPGYLPAFALAAGLIAFATGIAGNRLSRAVEARADTFALQLTGDPRGMIDLHRRLASRNLADPAPPGVFTFLFGTHPPAVERIGAAVAWERGERP